ncbi:MAG: formylglycine-generating enzyme family protein [Treponema sp.]|jgi:formylglycine-generating enzyme required for sulfatase activity|nr:formylglycine-generating enzyme family protein [Treponema sp.]
MKKSVLHGPGFTWVSAVFLLAAALCAGCSMPASGGGEGGGTAAAPPVTAPAGFAYVAGGTVTGSDSYKMTVTVPNDPAYDFPGQTSTHKGVFVAGRKIVIAPFFMAKHETARRLWYEVQSWALANGYAFKNTISASGGSVSNPDKPVTNITWRDAVVWCNAYSEQAGLEPVYRSGGAVLRDSSDAAVFGNHNVQMDTAKNGYRLPTEAEREYAARGGDPAQADWMYRYAGSNNPDEVAWHYGNAKLVLQDGGGKAPNRLGIFDLSGNAQEWGWDWMHYGSDVTSQTPPDGVSYTSERYFQKPMAGGGVNANPTMSCVAYRWGYGDDYKDGYVGFRVLRKAE